MSKKYMSAIIAICMSFIIPVSVSAKESSPKADDIVNRNYSHTFTYTKSVVSLEPDVGTAGMPDNYKTVSFQVVLIGGMQFDRLTGKFVSASSPTASLSYSSPVDLGLYNVSTNKYDGGNYVTFSYKADMKGIVDIGIPVIINYGSVSDSFNATK